MPYVVMKGKLFVAKPNSHKSYTVFWDRAQTFEQLSDAMKNKCPNEIVMFMTNGSLSHVKEGS